MDTNPPDYGHVATDTVIVHQIDDLPPDLYFSLHTSEFLGLLFHFNGPFQRIQPGFVSVPKRFDHDLVRIKV